MTNQYPSTIELILFLVLLAWCFQWLWRRLSNNALTQSARVNEPLLPATPVLKQLAYLWWLVIGLWPERRKTVVRDNHPYYFKIALYGGRWILFIVFIMIVMLLWALL